MEKKRQKAKSVGLWGFFTHGIHHSLHSAHFYRSSSRVKVLDAASEEVEQSDKVYKSADAAVSFLISE